MDAALPDVINTEGELDEVLSRPTSALVEMMSRLDGDIAILGIGGKMGGTLGELAARAAAEAGAAKRIIGVSRFSDPNARRRIEDAGVETVECDLLDRDAVASLPPTPNVVFMAGRKFGTDGAEPLTWAMNALLPGNVAEHFAESRIVAFSTGCVYPLVPVSGTGSTEEDALCPVGEYAQSCLARERVFQYYSQRCGTHVCLIRLNYSIDLRYGILHDIASRIHTGEPVDLAVPVFNAIWQGDACAHTLLALEHCASPAAVLNVTGTEAIETRVAALQLGGAMGKLASFTGSEGDVAYLNDASRAIALFGPPRVSVERMIEWTARWVSSGGRSLGKPTHFEVNDGKY